MPRFLILFAGLLVAGCGHSFASHRTGEKANIRGKVTLNGSPMRGGTVTFAAANGNPQKASILDDGSYVVANVEPGNVKVIIDGEALHRSTNLGGGSSRRARPIKLPAKYLAAETTPFVFTATPGRQARDFDVQVDKAELDQLNPGGYEPPPAPQGRDRRGAPGKTPEKNPESNIVAPRGNEEQKKPADPGKDSTPPKKS
jgi:hypothetical protein